MYTHIKTKHVTLELRSYIGLCLLEEELSGNPASSFLLLKINSSLKISSDIQSPGLSVWQAPWLNVSELCQVLLR